jgi:ABC-2 type transport system ATP-binding protein
MSVLEIRGATKRFGAIEALAGVDLDLRDGEWLALLGPNGAGKTTLVRAIAGRVRLDRGEIVLLGERLASGGKGRGGRGRGGLGIVPQEVALFPLLTAAENLRAWGALNGVPADELAERVDWALGWTALADRSGEPVKGFSGGMKRRLNLACGVLRRPRVVLLDEPTAGVDPQSRQRIWEMLEELRLAGASLLLTTHQLDEAQQVADRIVIIDNGRVIAAGTLGELLRQTVGAERRVRFTLEGGAPPLAPEGFEVLEDGRLERRVERITHELQPLLRGLGERGFEVADLEIEAPSLQAVFLHLTGRELRE